MTPGPICTTTLWLALDGLAVGILWAVWAIGAGIWRWM
jgi:hypothetical protein